MKNTNNEKNKQQQHEASISHSIVYAFGEFTLDLKICKNKQIKEIEKKKSCFQLYNSIANSCLFGHVWPYSID